MNNSKGELILSHATRLFMERGFDKVTIRDIAKEADVNLALINYYFRSKDKLAAIIIENMSSRLHKILNPILFAEQDIKVKLEIYVSTFIDLLADEPGMILFLLSVLKNEPGIIYQTQLGNYLFDTSTFFKQLENEANKGKIRKVNAEQFYMCMLSLILFPFSIIDIISDRNDYTDKGITRYLRSRKDVITEMLLKYLEP